MRVCAFAVVFALTIATSNCFFFSFNFSPEPPGGAALPPGFPWAAIFQSSNSAPAPTPVPPATTTASSPAPATSQQSKPTVNPAASSSGVSYNGNGKFSFYNDAGYGACGSQINAASEMLAAVPSNLWTAASANSDPLCNQCVSASFKGKSIKVPIKDKCPGCSPDKVDLSQPAFQQLDNLDVGIIQGASWSIGSC